MSDKVNVPISQMIASALISTIAIENSKGNEAGMEIMIKSLLVLAQHGEKKACKTLISAFDVVDTEIKKRTGGGEVEIGSEVKDFVKDASNAVSGG